MVLALAPAALTPARAATVGPTDRFVPLALDGGSWSTQITLTNLAPKPANVVLTMITGNGANEAWPVVLTATSGKITANTLELTLAPGASAIVETSGEPANTTQGFVDIVELGDQPVGAVATLTQREADRVLQSIRMPLLPAHERRSLIPINLADETQSTRMVWVSLTSTTMLDLVFRDLEGATVLTDQLSFDGKAQLILDVREYWRELRAFRGTMQWSVSFPGADRYEQRILAGMCLVSKDNLPWSVVHSMTLPADQASASPYE